MPSRCFILRAMQFRLQNQPALRLNALVFSGNKQSITWYDFCPPPHAVMHFYYIDESGDTGENLDDSNQPVVVLGGISVRDEGWNSTQKALLTKLETFFDGTIPEGFELHATDLLSPNGGGPFAGRSRNDRCRLCLDLLGLLVERSHEVHCIAIDKQRIKTARLDLPLPYNPKCPYLLAFDYLITYINWCLKNRLGISARGMIILDRKEQFHRDIETILRERRFAGPSAHRVKWIVEFSYTVDSRKNPMIQLSDLVLYCTKRLIEIEHGYRDSWSQDAKDFYARCYALIHERVARQRLVMREGRNMDRLNAYIEHARLQPRTQWRRHYNFAA